MPELPEVEHAARRARAIAVGRTITSVRVLHRSQRRGLPARAARTLVGDTVAAVDRRAKEQRVRLTSGRELRVHFRMTGDWLVLAPGDRVPRTVRAVLGFDNGARLALDDPRALSTLSLCGAGGGDEGPLGPEATAVTAVALGDALSRRRIAIKQALLDQRVVAGVGNIYASEALWRARIDPRTPARNLDAAQVRRLAKAIRDTMAAALRRGERYYGSGEESGGRFKVYDREGEPCPRCGARIRRIVQGGRSSYFCERCIAHKRIS